MNYPQLAFDLYVLTRDPLVLDAIRVLLDPEDPSYLDAVNLVTVMDEARSLLTPMK